MATSTNYSGRKVDLLIMQGWKAPGEGSAKITLGFGTGSVVTGIMKLVQAFVIRLLTETGSSQRDPNFGTSFMSELRSGAIHTEADLQASFSSAVATARLQFLDEYDRLAVEKNTDVPDDERFSDAILEYATLTDGGVDITVRVVSEAGEMRDVVLPVSLAIT